MHTTELSEQLTTAGVVPVISIADACNALPMADALVLGGLPIVEITFRTPAAAEVIRILRRERPNVFVGAGTVLTMENLQSAKDAGAQFAVAPGLNPEIVQAAQRLGLPFMPGVATAGEIERALSLGCKLLKFFPAELLGGVEMVVALTAPYSHTGVRFVPTGGVTASNLEAYLRCESVTAVGGTWLAPKEDVTSDNWEAITQRCCDAVKQVRKLRGTSR